MHGDAGARTPRLSACGRATACARVCAVGLATLLSGRNRSFLRLFPLGYTSSRWSVASPEGSPTAQPVSALGCPKFLKPESVGQTGSPCAPWGVRDPLPKSPESHFLMLLPSRTFCAIIRSLRAGHTCVRFLNVLSICEPVSPPPNFLLAVLTAQSERGLVTDSH